MFKIKKWGIIFKSCVGLWIYYTFSLLIMFDNTFSFFFSFFFKKKKFRLILLQIINKFIYFSLTKIQNQFHIYIILINSYYYFRKKKLAKGLTNGYVWQPTFSHFLFLFCFIFCFLFLFFNFVFVFVVFFSSNKN